MVIPTRDGIFFDKILQRQPKTPSWCKGWKPIFPCLAGAFKSPLFDVRLHCYRFLMMQSNFTFHFFRFGSCLGLFLIYVICICIQHCIILYIDINIFYIVLICVSLASIIDYVYIDTYIWYLPLVFPVSSLFPFVPKFLQTS